MATIVPIACFQLVVGRAGGGDSSVEVGQHRCNAALSALAHCANPSLEMRPPAAHLDNGEQLLVERLELQGFVAAAIDEAAALEVHLDLIACVDLRGDALNSAAKTVCPR